MQVDSKVDLPAPRPEKEVSMALPRFAFFNGRVVPYGEAKVGLLTHALQYGTGCFGGIRGFWNEQEQELFVFRPYDHFRRFLDSARILSLAVPYSEAELVDFLGQLLREEGLRTDCYIRPNIFASDERIGNIGLVGASVTVSIVAVPFGKYVKNDEGAHLTISGWRRIDDNMIPARGKICGAYANTALAKTDAQRAGFDDAIFLDQGGHVAEASAANIFIVRDGTAITPPITDNVLEGVTRRTVLQLIAEELKIPVVERTVDRTELFVADEVFLCGTGFQVVAVTRVDHRPIGSGRMGNLTTSIRTLNEEVVRGRVPRYRSWCAPVWAHAPSAARA
jgi:branched-chain amino acid aminotransferase